MGRAWGTTLPATTRPAGQVPVSRAAPRDPFNDASEAGPSGWPRPAERTTFGIACAGVTRRRGIAARTRAAECTVAGRTVPASGLSQAASGTVSPRPHMGQIGQSVSTSQSRQSRATASASTILFPHRNRDWPAYVQPRDQNGPPSREKMEEGAPCRRSASTRCPRQPPSRGTTPPIYLTSWASWCAPFRPSHRVSGTVVSQLGPQIPAPCQTNTSVSPRVIPLLLAQLGCT